MIPSAACILYTEDSDFVRRTRAFLRSSIEVRHVDHANRLDPMLQQNHPALLLIDLRSKESQELIEQVQLEWRDVLIIGFGVPRSEPLRHAERLGIYATEDLKLERHYFQVLVGRALDHLRVLEDNRVL